MHAQVAFQVADVADGRFGFAEAGVTVAQIDARVVAEFKGYAQSHVPGQVGFLVGAQPLGAQVDGKIS